MPWFSSKKGTAAQDVRFEELRGPGVELIKGGLALRQTRARVNALSFADPVLCSGTASATFRVDFKAEQYLFVIGVFPANQVLDSYIGSADGKRVALWVEGGMARMLSDGVKADPLKYLGWKPGDTVSADVAFEGSTTARVTLRFKERAETRMLKDVPACGLRFGVGLYHKGAAVTLLASSVDAPEPSPSEAGTQGSLTQVQSAGASSSEHHLSEAQLEAARREAETAAREEQELEELLEAPSFGRRRREAEAKARREAAAVEAEETARREAAEKARLEAEERARQQAEEERQKRREAEERARREAEEEAARLAAAEAARLAAEEAARVAAAEAARREAEERARREAEEKARREAEEKARREAEEKARREAEEKARREAEEKARREAEEKARHARSAAVLLQKWSIDPSDLSFGDALGRGSQADVRRGEWRGTEVALKIPALSAERAAPFLRREVRALHRVHHSNVVQLYGVCLDGPRPCVVMALASGHLGDRLASRTSSLVLDARLLGGIARGMAAVHAHKILHLDLKPENVLRAPDGTPWVSDFGLSTSLGSSGSKGDGRGTLPFQAPELFRSKKKGGALVSEAVDVYAFGVLAWQVLTRARPWAELDMPQTEIPENVKEGERPELIDGTDWRGLGPSSRALAPLVEACWAQDHGTRPEFGGDGGVAAQLGAIEAKASEAETLLGSTHAAEELDAAGRRAQQAEEELALVRAQMAEIASLHAASEQEKQFLKDENDASDQDSNWVSAHSQAWSRFTPVPDCRRGWQLPRALRRVRLWTRGGGLRRLWHVARTRQSFNRRHRGHHPARMRMA